MPRPETPITPTQVSRKTQRELVAMRPTLLSFARKHVRNPDLAEDMVQQALCQFLRFGHNYEDRGPNSLRNYLCLILLNEYRTYVRRPTNNREFYVGNDESGKLSNALAISDQHIRLELIDTLNALDLLQPEQATCVLGAALGEEQLDSSIRTGIPHGTVKSRVSRGRQRLRELAGYSDRS